MANYSIDQLVYSDSSQCLTPILQNKRPINIYNTQSEKDKAGDRGIAQYAPYQQILLNPSPEESDDYLINFTGFKKNNPYYLRVTIPRDTNYNLNFALQLIPEYRDKLAASGYDLDQMDYQFIKYINVPQDALNELDTSRVILYEWPQDGTVDTYTGKSENVEIAIAQKYPGTTAITDGALVAGVPAIDKITTTDNNSKIKSYNQKAIWYTVDEYGDYSYWYMSEEGGRTIWKALKVGKTDITLTHSWVSAASDNSITYEIIFTPRIDGLKYLYLYLIPMKADNDIQWTDGIHNYYGRHVDLKRVSVSLYQMKNLLGNGITVRRLGIWGRSEQMFTINGEEIKIGPSGYYELQNFPVTWLSIAALNDADRYTIDIQY